MKDVILKVLNRYKDRQINLSSRATRELIADEIMAVANSREAQFEGWSDEDIEKYKALWTCNLCGKHTYDVDYDYIGHGTNHLACELKQEAKDTIDRKVPTTLFGEEFIDNNDYNNENQMELKFDD
tara:strand:- start:7543 stop:7920 length:378 start_codon:yes stop_codon:yes gene_type:complete